MATMTFFLFGFASLVMISIVHLIKRSHLLHSSANLKGGDIPVIGVREEWFGITRAAFRQLTSGITTLLDGYTKVNT